MGSFAILKNKNSKIISIFGETYNSYETLFTKTFFIACNAIICINGICTGIQDNQRQG